MTTTIRKNSWKRIEQILKSAVMIREFRYDDMGDTAGQVTMERVIEMGQKYEFDRINSYEGVTTFRIHGNWSFTAYETVEAARRNLTPQAFAKYFPNN